MQHSLRADKRFGLTARAAFLGPAAIAAIISISACASARGLPIVSSPPSSAVAVAPHGVAPRMVFFGDSITYGIGSGDDQCFPTKASSDCYADIVTRDAGATIAELRGAREKNMGVVGSCLVPTHTPRSVCLKAVSGKARIPRFIVACRTAGYAAILFGANDALDSAVTIEAFTRVLTDAVDGCHSAGVPLRRIFIGETTFRPRVSDAYLQSRVAQLDAAETAVAATTHARLADTFDPLKRCGKPCFHDWVHPNEHGHRILAEAFLRALAAAK